MLSFELGKNEKRLYLPARDKGTAFNESTKSLPIHCVIEQTPGPPSFEAGSTSGQQITVELDSYAILPGTTLLNELVRAALIKLGYTSTEAMGAKGAIQIKNWKPLSFDNITDNTQATLDEILGELTQVATLRIRLPSLMRPNSAEDVKEKLLQLLLKQSQSLLINQGCPIEKGQMPPNISPEMIVSFDKWYNEQLNRHLSLADVVKVGDKHGDKPSTPSSPVSSVHDMRVSPSQPLGSSTPNQSITSSHSSFFHCKTRMRTSFDPEHEIPRLQKWFQDNQHPSREQMLQYLNELNSLESRKGRRPLDLTNIIYWFKNARAAHRRASRNMDDSYELEEGDTSCSSEHNSMPFLPNRNAVYLFPYHLHSMANQSLAQEQMMNGQMECREPCDLTVAKKLNSPKLDTQKNGKSLDNEPLSMKIEAEQDARENMKVDIDFAEDRKTPDKLQEDKDVLNTRTSLAREEEDKEEVQEKDGIIVNRDLESQNGKKVDIKHETEESDDVRVNGNRDYQDDDVRVNGNRDYQDDDVRVNGKRDYQSGDEYLDSDGEESDFDDSLSSHDSKGMKYNNDEHVFNKLNHGPHQRSELGGAMHQPLHIPQFPHPLAMHYFPLNTHLFSQQANQMKFAQQQQQQHTQQSYHHHQHHSKSGQENSQHRKRRTRVFIDPLTEIPKLEKWFTEDTHPSAYMIDKYCDELNSSEYRQKFPRLEPKNVQLWFKNHRAKVKRMRLTNSY
ncbi:hypothetical protein ACJMK2_000291 [Sinanodonta woodiana]|uniref:DNA-binding protein SATB2 n=1 Tax=Sinanodonta woodiana TaxID=1069815 RepID=A0ABD3XNS5_SINWO